MQTIIEMRKYSSLHHKRNRWAATNDNHWSFQAKLYGSARYHRHQIRIQTHHFGFLDGETVGFLDGFVVGVWEGFLEGITEGTRVGFAMGTREGFVEGRFEEGLALGRLGATITVKQTIGCNEMMVRNVKQKVPVGFRVGIEGTAVGDAKFMWQKSKNIK